MIYVAIQTNGERIRFEEWAIKAWQRGEVADPLMLRYLNGAVAIMEAAQ